MMVASFSSLVLMHALEGHYSCCCNSQSSDEKKKKSGKQYWKVVTFVYELNVVVIIFITFSFWSVVFPVMVHIRYVKNSMAWLSLTLAHLLPFLGVAIDFYLSTVQFYLRHVIIFVTFGLMYLAYHFLQTFYLRGPK